MKQYPGILEVQNTFFLLKVHKKFINILLSDQFMACLLYTGVTTIAGGKWGQLGGHVDGPSEDAKFSNDFDVIYARSSCSLLVVDRGNQAIREIQLHHDDCTTYEDDSSLHLGITRPSIRVYGWY